MRHRADGFPRERTNCAPGRTRSRQSAPGRRGRARPKCFTTPWAGIACGVLLAAWPAAAAAQRTEGTVLQVSGNELLVDLGADDGIAPGDAVRIYRRIVVEHPISHRSIEDRFPIGEEQLEQVAQRMSIIILDTPFDHAPSVGDTVVLLERGGPGPATTTTTAGGEAQCPVCEAQQCPANAPGTLDPEVAEVLRAFGNTLGQPLEQRITTWEGYLALHPNAPWAPAIAADVESLRALLRTTRGGTPALAAGGRSRIGHMPPQEAFVGEPVEIAFAIDAPDALRLAQVHVRRQGESGYRAFDLERDGDFYLRGIVPPEFVAPDGFEYFIVGVASAGEEVPLGGSPERPIAVPVSERVETPPVRTDRSNLHTSFEYVDFYANQFARDYYLRFEADFRYVLGMWFYGLRMGFGILDGSGGPVKRIDLPSTDPNYLEVQPISYRYGFAELEFRLHELFYVIGRISFGSARAYALADGRTRSPEALVGGGGAVRIGRPSGTNLELGAGYIEDLGWEANVSVNLALVDRVPLRGHIIVTDMPVEEEVGVRLVAEAGYQPASWLEFTVLAGYDIRRIYHQGVSFGLATVFLW